MSWNRRAGAFAEPPHIDTAVERSAELAPRAIAVGFTSSSYVRGPAADGPLRLRLEKISRGVPVVLSAPAAVDALRAVGVRRVAVIHPPWFNDEVNARGRDYFHLQGFEVMLCAQLKPARSFTEVPAPEVFKWVSANAPQQAEAILLSVTAFAPSARFGRSNGDCAGPCSPRTRSCSGRRCERYGSQRR